MVANDITTQCGTEKPTFHRDVQLPYYPKIFSFSHSNPPELYRVSQGECARIRESVPYVKVYRYNPKHLYPKLNGYGDNGQRNL